MILLAVAALASFGAVKFVLAQMKEPEEVEKVETIRKVEVKKVEPEQHQAETKLIGSLKALQRIEVYAEVGGILLNDNLKEGTRVKKGAPLLKIENTDFALSLKAQKSQFISQVAAVMGDLKTDFSDEFSKWETFLNALNVDQPMPALPEMASSKLKRFISGKNILNSYYSILSNQEKLSKYTVEAPFDGVVTLATVDKGSLVRMGQKVGEFISTDQMEYVSEVSVSDLNYLTVGNTLKLYSEDLGKEWTGKIYRINEKLEENSQMVKIFAKVEGSGLKEGMFLTGMAYSKTLEDAIEVDRSLLQDHQLYVAEDGKVKAYDVKVLHINGKKAIVRGLKSGQMLIMGNVKGLYDGMAITLN